MNANFTLNLVRYIYNETSIAQRLKIEEEVNSNFAKSCSLTELKMGFNSLPKVSFTPSKSVINNILKYSENSTVEA